MAGAFKKGDLVSALESYGGEFTEGRLYKVIASDNGRTSVESDDNGRPNGWLTDRFELVSTSTRVRRTELLISAMPEGGFLVTEPSRAAYDMQKHLAAFTRLPDAVQFIEEAMA